MLSIRFVPAILEAMSSETELAVLDRLASTMGIDRDYHDGFARPRRAGDDAVVAVLSRLGAEIERPCDAADALRALEARAARESTPELVTVDEGDVLAFRMNVGGEGTPLARIQFASGEVRPLGVELCGPLEIEARGAPCLELGIHQVVVERGGWSHRFSLLVAPSRMAPLAAGGLGVFAPLYALHSVGGFATYGDLARIAGYAAGASRGPATLGTLPLLACFFEQPFEPSPYSPISRRFWSEIYVDPSRAAGFGDCDDARRIVGSNAYAEAMAARTAAGLLDYRRIAGARRRALEALEHHGRDGRRGRDLDATLAADADLAAYAAFRAAVERYATTWDGFPESARSGRLKPGRDYDEEAYRYHAYAAELARGQLEEAARAVNDRGGLYLDLPVGSHGGGYDTWKDRDAFAHGLAVGAPPDPVFEGGQCWAFPPLHPSRARAGIYAPLRDALVRHFAVASTLRIDHVMGLHRLYVVPDGFDASEGMYLRYRSDELWRVVALEASRRRAAVIGEDLGTVPDEVRAQMEERGAHRMYVLPFEQLPGKQGFSPVPAQAMACLETHDMEPFAAWWEGLGERGAEIAAGLAERGLLAAGECAPAAVLAALLAYLGRSDAALVVVNLEDLWLETRRQNMPGTDAAAGNWQRPLALSLEAIERDENVARLLSELRDERLRT